MRQRVPARRAVKRREPPMRGWGTFNGGFAIVGDVTNVPHTKFDYVWEGADLEGSEQTEALVVDKSEQDYYIERVKCYFELIGQAGGESTNSFLDVWIGLAVLSESAASGEDVAGTISEGIFAASGWRGDNRVRRILDVRLVRVVLDQFAMATRYAVGCFDGNMNGMGDWPHQFDVKSKLFLRNDEVLCLVMGKSGIADDFIVWDSGDTVTVKYTGAVLVRQKRGT